MQIDVFAQRGGSHTPICKLLCVCSM